MRLLISSSRSFTAPCSSISCRCWLLHALWPPSPSVSQDELNEDAKAAILAATAAWLSRGASGDAAGAALAAIAAGMKARSASGMCVVSSVC